MVRRRWLMAVPAVAFAFALLLASAPAGAQTGASSLKVTPARGTVGSTVTLSGQNCGTAGSVTLEFDGVPAQGTAGAVQLLDVKPDSGGHFSVSFVIPATLGGMQGDQGGPTAPGAYLFDAHVPGCTAPFTVTAVTAVVARLPRTGSSSQQLAVLALGLMLAGAGALLAAGRRAHLPNP